jgi:hypothetical protein
MKFRYWIQCWLADRLWPIGNWAWDYLPRRVKVWFFLNCDIL